MQTLLIAAVTNTFSAALLASIALVVGKVVRRPALMHTLWLLVLLKLVTPPVWSVPVKFGAAPHRAAPTVATDHPLLEPSIPTPSHFVSMPKSRPRFEPRTAALRSICTVWFFGTFCCIGIVGMRLRRFVRILRYAQVAPEEVQSMAGTLARRLGLASSPGVWFIPAGISPMLFGFGRRVRLLVPQRLWEKLNDQQRSAVLLHELAHLRRRDHWVRVVELAVTLIYWWNPLAWWARKRLRAAEELCCDAWVTWSMPAAVDEYARALVEAVEFVCVSRSQSRPVLPALASGIGEFRHLERRLVMIQQGRSTRTLGRTGLAAVAIVAIALPLTLSRAQDEKSAHDSESSAAAKKEHQPETAPAEKKEEHGVKDPAVRAQLKRPMPELNFQGVAFSDVIDFLRDVSGANIFVNWKTLENANVDPNTPITLRLRNVPVGEALDLILSAAAGKQNLLAYQVKGNVITISTVKDLGGPAGLVTRTYDVHELVDGKNDKRADELVKMITGSIDPTSWAENGGESGSAKIDDGKLIVAQTPDNQEAVKNLLKHARELMKKQ